MTGFKLRTSGNGSDRSTNWATTTAQMVICYGYKLCARNDPKKYLGTFTGFLLSELFSFEPFDPH